MNDRIKQFVKDAGAVPIHGKPRDRALVGYDNIGKFAELIVEECRSVVSRVYRNTPLELCGPLLTVDEKIAEHFYGVE
jgi:hypothetical protein